MISIQKIMACDHKRCDELFARAESAVAEKQWDMAEEYAGNFFQAMHQHFEQEEERLFPAFEDKTGSTNGPTMMMRHEHEKIRDLMESMHSALQDKNVHRYLSLSETLLIFMQQHNMKEEQILYPMIENNCSERTDELMKDFNNNCDCDAA